MIDVGEGGEAYRLLFERYPPVPLDRADLPGSPDLLARARLILSGISTDYVGIKLNARDRLRRVRLGVLSRTQGYVAIVPPVREGESHTFYSLSGREQLMIRERGKLAYPFFGSRELARIREKVVASPNPPAPAATEAAKHAPAREPARPSDLEGLVVPAPRTDDMPFQGEKTPTLSEWTRFGARAEQAVAELFELFGAETRVYEVAGVERKVKLLRHLTVMVRQEGCDEQCEATLLHDGKRICALFGIKTREAMTIRALTREDEIRLPTW